MVSFVLYRFDIYLIEVNLSGFFEIVALNIFACID